MFDLTLLQVLAEACEVNALEYWNTTSASWAQAAADLYSAMLSTNDRHRELFVNGAYEAVLRALKEEESHV